MTPTDPFEQLTSSRLIAILLAILCVVAVGFVLYQLKVVLLPFTVAALFSVVFEPVIRFLRQRRLPTVLGLVLIFLFLGLLATLLSVVLASSAAAFLEALPRYEARFDALFATLLEWIQALAARLRMTPPDLSAPFSFTSVTAAVSAGMNTLVSVISTAFLILLFMLFMLLGTGASNSKLRQVLPAAKAERIALAGVNIGRHVRQYLVTKTLISALTGTITFLILWVIGVDFAFMWGVLTFLLNYIPNIGSIIAALLPTIWAILQFDTIGQAVATGILLTSIQATLGNIIEPRWMASSMSLSPLLVLVALIFWGWLWGIWGMILAVPLMSTLKIVLENISPLRPLAVLMGDVRAKPVE